MGVQFTITFVIAMKLLMIFALLVVTTAAAKNSDDPCVPCEVLKYAIKVCPDCEILHDIWNKICEEIPIDPTEEKPCVPCELIRKAIDQCPECQVLYTIYEKYCDDEVVTAEPNEPCVPCELLKQAISLCPDCQILYDIWEKYCEEVPIDYEDEPCVPCEVIRKAIEMCPDCPVLYEIYKKYCDEEVTTSTISSTTSSTSTVVPNEPCVPCEQLKKAIYLCPDCEILLKIYFKNCMEITSDPEPNDSSIKFTPQPSSDPCVPCKAIKTAIMYCPNCQVLYGIYQKYCQTSPVTISNVVKG